MVFQKNAALYAYNAMKVKKAAIFHSNEISHSVNDRLFFYGNIWQCLGNHCVKCCLQLTLLT